MCVLPPLAQTGEMCSSPRGALWCAEPRVTPQATPTSLIAISLIILSWRCAAVGGCDGWGGDGTGSTLGGQINECSSRADDVGVGQVAGHVARSRGGKHWWAARREHQHFASTTTQPHVYGQHTREGGGPRPCHTRSTPPVSAALSSGTPPPPQQVLSGGGPLRKCSFPWNQHGANDRAGTVCENVRWCSSFHHPTPRGKTSDAGKTCCPQRRQLLNASLLWARGKRQISRVSEPASRRQDHLGREHRSLQEEAVKSNEEPFSVTLRMGRLIYGWREALLGEWEGGGVNGR
ncbi:hypothetical protein E2C01_059588 [Portunus trituberculatus]|uniref:Uncharacterized protein n=1 Tax=Portunus trituberculatus TaxID=210409 RepID=A0A5B7H9G6_PORTR|nr:hypothetical protein [Portunus trituberculatus]